MTPDVYMTPVTADQARTVTAKIILACQLMTGKIISVIVLIIFLDGHFMCIEPCWTNCPTRSELSVGHQHQRSLEVCTRTHGVYQFLRYCLLLYICVLNSTVVVLIFIFYYFIQGPGWKLQNSQTCPLGFFFIFGFFSTPTNEIVHLYR